MEIFFCLVLVWLALFIGVGALAIHNARQVRKNISAAANSQGSAPSGDRLAADHTRSRWRSAFALKSEKLFLNCGADFARGRIAAATKQGSFRRAWMEPIAEGEEFLGRIRSGSFDIFSARSCPVRGMVVVTVASGGVGTVVRVCISGSFYLLAAGALAFAAIFDLFPVTPVSIGAVLTTLVIGFMFKVLVDSARLKCTISRDLARILDNRSSGGSRRPGGL